MHSIWSFIVPLQLYWSLATSQVSPSSIGNGLNTGSMNLSPTSADQLDSNLLTPSASDLSSGATLITGLHVTNFFDRTNIVCSELTTNTANIVCRELTTNTANMVMASSSSGMFKQPDISSQNVLETSSTFDSQSSEAVFSFTSEEVRNKPLSLTVFSTDPVQNLQSVYFERSFFVPSDTIAAKPSKMSTEPTGTEMSSVLATIEPSRAVVSSSSELGLATIEPSRASVSSSSELGLATIEPSRAVVSSSSELELATIEPSRAVEPSSSELKNTRNETSTFRVLSSGEVVLARISIEPTLTLVSSSRKTDTPSRTLAEAFSVLNMFTAYALDSQNRVLQDSLTLYETSLSDSFAEKTISIYSASIFPEKIMSLFSTIENTILVSAVHPLSEKISASTALPEKAPSMSGTSADLAESIYFSVASTKTGVLDTFGTLISQDTANSVHGILGTTSLEPSEVEVISIETVRPIEMLSSSVQSQALQSVTFSNVSEASSHAGLPSVTHPITRSTERTGHSEKETATNILTTVQSPPLEIVYSIVNDSAVLNLTSSGTILVESTFQTSAITVVNTSSAVFVTSSFKEVSSVNEFSTGYSIVSSLRTASSDLPYLSIHLDTVSIKTKPFTASIFSSSLPLPEIVSSPVSTVPFSDVMVVTAFPSSTFSLLTVNTIYSAYKSTPSTFLATVNTINADDMTISLHPTAVLFSSLSSVLMPSNTVEGTTFPLSSAIVQPTSTMVVSSSPTNSSFVSALNTDDTSVLLSTIFSTLGSTLMSNSSFIVTSAVNMTTIHTIFPELTSSIGTIMSEITPSALLGNTDTNNKSELTPSSVSGNTKNISENTIITHIVPSSVITETATLFTTNSEDKTVSLHSSAILFSSLASALMPTNTVEVTTFLLPSEMILSSTKTNSSFVSVLNTNDTSVLLSTMFSTLWSTTVSNSSFIVNSAVTMTTIHTIFPEPTSSMHTIMSEITHSAMLGNSGTNNKSELTSSSVLVNTNTETISENTVITHTGMIFTTNSEEKTVSLQSSTILFSSLSSILMPTNTVEGTTFPLSSEMIIPSTTIFVFSSSTNSSYLSVLNTSDQLILQSTMFFSSGSTTMPNSSFIITSAVTMTTIHTIFPELTSSMYTIMSEITHTAMLGNSDTNNKSELTPSSVSGNTDTKNISENTIITHIAPSSVITETATLFTTNSEDKTLSLHSSAILFSSLSTVLMPTNTVEVTTFLLPSEMILSSTKTNSSFVSVLNTNDTSVFLSTMFSTLWSTKISNSSFIVTSSFITETWTLFTTNAEDKTVSLQSSTILFSSLSSILMPTNTVEGTTFPLSSEIVQPTSTMVVSLSPTNSSFVSALNTNDTSVLQSTIFSTLESTSMSDSSFIVTSAVTMTTIHTIFPELPSSIGTIMSELTPSALLGNSDTNNKSELTPSSVSGNTNTKNISENTIITHIVPSSVITETVNLFTTNAQDKTVSLQSSTIFFASLSSVVMPSNTVEGTTFPLSSEMITPSTTIFVFSSSTNSSYLSVLNTSDQLILQSTMFFSLGSTTMPNSSFIVTSAVTMTTIHTIFPELTSSIGTIMSEITHTAMLGNSDTNNKSELTPSSVSGNTNTKDISENTIITHIVPSSVITETATLFTTNSEDKTLSLHSSAILFSSLSSILMPTNTVEGTTFRLSSEIVQPTSTMVVSSSPTSSSFVPALNTNDTSVLLSTMFSTLGSTTVSNSPFIVTSAVTMTTIHTIFPELTSSIGTIMSEITHTAMLGNSDTNSKSELTPSSVSGNTNTKNISKNTVITHIVPSSVITETVTLFTTNTKDKTVSLQSSTILFSSLSSVVMPTNTVGGTTFPLSSEMTIPSTTIFVFSSSTNSSYLSVLNTSDQLVLQSTMLFSLGSTAMPNSSFIVTSAVTMTTIHTIFPELTSSIGTIMSENTHTAMLGNSDTNNKSELAPSSVSGNTNTKNISENTIMTHIVPSSVITEAVTLFTTNAEDKTVSLHSSAILFSSLSSVLMPTNTVEGTTFPLTSEIVQKTSTMVVSSPPTNSSFLSVLNTNDTSVLLSTMFSTLGSTTMLNSSFIITSAVTMTTSHPVFPELTSAIGTILSELTSSNVLGNTSTKNISEHTVITPIVHSSVIAETGTGTQFLNSTLIAGLATSGQMSTPSTMTSVTMATSHSPILNVTSSASMGPIMPSSVPVTSTDFTKTTSILTSAWSSLPLTSFLHTTDTDIFQNSSVTPVLTSNIVNLTPSFIASSALTSSINVTIISTPIYTTAGITIMPTSVLMTQLISLISDTVTPEIFSTSAFNNITVNLTHETTTLTTAVVFSNVTEVVFSNVTEVVFSNVTEVVSSNVSVHATLAESTISMSVYNVSATKMPTLSASTAAATIFTSLATSSAVLTTTVEPSTSTATIQPSKAPWNITEAGENYWVVTVLKVPKTKNISSPTFRRNLEADLAEAYLQAYTRKEYIRLGVFDPLKKRRRRRKKRYTKTEDTAVHVQRISQDAGTNAVSVAYSVENNGSVVPAVDAVNTLALMDIQELAIILKEVVSTKAETYIKFVSSGGDTAVAGGLAVWMIAAIAGGVAALIIIIFVVACCYFKCCHKQQKTDIEGQPQLVGLKTSKEEEGEPEFLVTHADPEYLKEQSKQGSKASLLSQKSRKSQRYEVTQPRVEEETPMKKRDLSRSKASNIIEAHSEDSMDKKAVEGVISPSKHRNGRLKESNLLNDLTPGPEDSPILFRTMSDEDEELKKKAEMERKLNKERIKERIRDRRNKEKNQGPANESLRDYFQTWEEIDRVLEAPAENGLPHVFVDSSRDKKKKDKELGQSNEGFAMEEETLEEARKRMHKLLDETFSLVSPDASSLELRKAARSLSPSSAGHESVKEELSDDDTAHTPMYVTPGTYSKPILETWSPYRASDQVALISLPKSQQTTIKSATTQPQTKPLRRPVASFPEPSTVASQERKYTTSPPKPIVITSRELLEPSTLDKQKPVSALTLISDVSKGLKNSSLGKLSYTQINRDDTNLPQSDHLMTNGNAGSFEMKTLKNSQGKRRKHKRHGHEPKNCDEIDIITNNLKTGESTADYIRSIRNEIQHKPDRMDPQRKLRTSMTDIV